MHGVDPLISVDPPPPGWGLKRLSETRLEKLLALPPTLAGHPRHFWRAHEFVKRSHAPTSIHSRKDRSGLAPPTPCRSPGALRVLPPQPRSRVSTNQRCRSKPRGTASQRSVAPQLIRSKPVRLGVRDHHTRSVCAESPAQTAQWCCWLCRRRIIFGPTCARGRGMLAAGPELRITGAAAQTRMVSVARIRLGSCESARAFKGIICDDISEFESYMPSQAVRSLCARLLTRCF